jgi:lipoate-protein ligase A
MLIMYQFKAEFTAKHGKITELSVDYNSVKDENLLKSSLLNREIHKVTDWEEVFPSSLDRPPRVDVEDQGGEKVLTPGRGMNELFGAGNYFPSEYLRE